jgi:CubicO group peptidase (beta-lactamase class C family)
VVGRRDRSGAGGFVLAHGERARHLTTLGGVSRSIEELVATLDAEIPAAIARHRVPGLAIGICDAGGTRWSAGYGTTARDGGAPVTTATSFSVQSTSKLVTATAAMLAVQVGLVDLDAPIARHLPGFTVNSSFETDPVAHITLRHLLSHTAGFTHEAPVGSNYDVGDGGFDAHCASISRTWLRFPVGHHYEYSNLGIDLAGWILQAAGGAPFAEWVARELFAPLGMTRSTFDAAAIEADADRALGHWRPFERAGATLPVAVPMVASGGLYTSVDDALRFVGLHLRGGAPLLEPELIAEQYRVPFPAAPEQPLGYGLGVYDDEWDGVRVHHHGGSGFGFQAQLCWLPEHGIGAVVLTNSFDHDLQNELSRRIVAHVAGGPSPMPAPAPVPAADLDLDAAAELAGEYVGRLDDGVHVLVENGRLLVRDGNGTHAARLVAERTIELATPGRERFRFAPGRDGAIAYMLALRDGTARYRNDAARTPPSTLAPAHAGTYESRSWGVPTGRWRLAQDGASPTIGQLGDGCPEPAVALRLAPVEPGLWLSSMGEALDLRSATPTYANIELTTPGAAPGTEEETT